MQSQTSPTLQAALQCLSETAIPVLAGGTDLFPGLGDAPVPERLLDISRIDELHGVTQTAEGWRIGAATTWTDVVTQSLPAAFDGLKAAAREIGSIQIQNTGTVAGNLCNASPAADGVPALLVLNACVELASVRGVRQMPLHDFITGPRRTLREPDELLTAVLVPALDSSTRSAFVKLGARRYLVISIAMVSLLLSKDEDGRLADVRLAVGACSAVAQRLRHLEALLLGRELNRDLLSLVTVESLPELKPIDDVRCSAVHRMQAARQLVRHLLERAVSDALPGASVPFPATMMEVHS